MSVEIKNNPIDTEYQKQVYFKVKKAIAEGDLLIPLEAYFYLTKTKPGKGSAYIYRDRQLEKDTFEWMEQRISLKKIMERYQAFEPNVKIDKKWPKHFAGRLAIAEGVLKKGHDVFMFFPEVLGLEPCYPDMECFGFEFIDMWTSAVLEVIIPCVRRVFDTETVLTFYELLRPQVEKIIYLAAVFHEVGHRVTAWRVSPKKLANIHITQQQFDILGELTTDITMASFMKEFPEIQAFVYLERLFWLGRKGFNKNPISGNMASDGDCWNSAYLWNKYLAHNAFELVKKTKAWHANLEVFPDVFEEVILEVRSLGSEIIEIKSVEAQRELVNEWMLDKVPTKFGNYVFPDTLRDVYQQCSAVPYNIVNKFI